MTTRNFFSSRLGVTIPILLSKILSPKFSSRLISFTARKLAQNRDSDLIQAIRANQWVVRGEQSTSREYLDQCVIEVLEHAGQCYYDYYRSLDNREAILDLVPPTGTIKSFLAEMKTTRGAFITGPHLSNFDLAVRSMAVQGLEARVLSYAEPTGGYQLQNQLRESAGLEVTPIGVPDIFEKTVAFLKNGGVAATGIDRPVETRKKRHQIEFFGRPSNVPIAYMQLALAADVPIYVIGTERLSDGTYQVKTQGPIPLTRNSNRLLEIKENTRAVLNVCEKWIRERPEQWLMYYPVWPDTLDLLP